MSNKIKFFLLMAFIIAAVVSIKLSGLDRHLDQERLRTWISSYGAWGPIAYIILYSIAPSLMFPGVPITVAGGILFGPVGGTIYTSIGATIGASIAFLISRYLGRDWVEAMLKDRWKELDAKVERQGWKVVAFTRLIPLFPFNMLNYAFGLTRIRFSHYFFASFIFMLPGVVAYILFSSSLLGLFRGNVSGEFVIGLILVVIVSAIPIIYRRKSH
ncbi:MAG: TVP38/TMEM64 family protein [Deltaproteobacteria bacterium]